MLAADKRTVTSRPPTPSVSCVRRLPVTMSPRGRPSRPRGTLIGRRPRTGTRRRGDGRKTCRSERRDLLSRRDFNGYGDHLRRRPRGSEGFRNPTGFLEWPPSSALATTAPAAAATRRGPDRSTRRTHAATASASVHRVLEPLIPILPIPRWFDARTQLVDLSRMTRTSTACSSSATSSRQPRDSRLRRERARR
jgi:hypothetical protein